MGFLPSIASSYIISLLFGRVIATYKNFISTHSIENLRYTSSLCFFESESDFSLILDLTLVPAPLLFLELAHQLLDVGLLGVEAVEVHEERLVDLDSLHLLQLDVIEELPLGLLHVAQVEEVVEDHVVKFQSLRLVDSQAEHVAEDLRDIVLRTLVSHDDHLIATELRGCQLAPRMLGDCRARKEGAEVVVV
jgi:hypothetical protein